eukprot:COSAG01_NODE_809_length_13431_cov_12.268677_3_plen_196_part_00
MACRITMLSQEPAQDVMWGQQVRNREGHLWEAYRRYFEALSEENFLVLMQEFSNDVGDQNREPGMDSFVEYILDDYYKFMVDTYISQWQQKGYLEHKYLQVIFSYIDDDGELTPQKSVNYMGCKIPANTTKAEFVEWLSQQANTPEVDERTWTMASCCHYGHGDGTNGAEPCWEKDSAFGQMYTDCNGKFFAEDS